MATNKKSLFIAALSLNLLFVGGWLSSWFGQLTCIYSSKFPLIAEDNPAYSHFRTEAGIWAFAIGSGSHLDSEFSLFEFVPNSKRSSRSWYTPQDHDPFSEPFPTPTLANTIIGTYGFGFSRGLSFVLPFWIPVALISGTMLGLWTTRKQPAELGEGGKASPATS